MVCTMILMDFTDLYIQENVL